MRHVSATVVRRSRLAAALAVAALLAAGCSTVSPRKSIGGQCELNSECAAPLVCRLDHCRKECATSRDCAAGLTCVLDADGFGACQLPEERSCALQTDCPTPLVCRDARCVNACVEVGATRDCPSGAVCAELEGGLGCIDRGETPCVYDGECAGSGPGFRCIDGRCREACRYDRDCRRDQVCRMNACIPFGALPDGGLPDGSSSDGALLDGARTDGGGMYVGRHVHFTLNGTTSIDFEVVGQGQSVGTLPGCSLYWFDLDHASAFGAVTGDLIEDAPPGAPPEGQWWFHWEAGPDGTFDPSCAVLDAGWTLGGQRYDLTGFPTRTIDFSTSDQVGEGDWSRTDGMSGGFFMFQLP